MPIILPFLLNCARKARGLSALLEGRCQHFWQMCIPEGELTAGGWVVIDILHNEGYLDTVFLAPGGSVPHENFQRDGGILS